MRYSEWTDRDLDVWVDHLRQALDNQRTVRIRDIARMAELERDLKAIEAEIVRRSTDEHHGAKDT